MNVVPENPNAEVPATSAEPTAAKSPRVARRAPNMALSGAKPGKQAAPDRKAKKGRRPAKLAKNPGGPCKGSKTARFLDLLKRSGGATGAELMKTTGWQAHSVRGFISGILTRKMGLKITSTKAENGVRRYTLKS